MKILVTGFTPFGGEEINPSELVALNLPQQINGNTLVKAILPTAFGDSASQLDDLISVHQPDAIVMLGQAGGRKGITIEKVAINYAEHRGYDDKQTLFGNTIDNHGREAYFSTLPLKEMICAVNNVGVACALSLSAGSFVCNYITYHALALTYGSKIKVGFIHLPYCELQLKGKPQDTPYLTVNDMIKAVTAALSVF